MQHLEEQRLEELIDSKILNAITKHAEPDYLTVVNYTELLNYIGGIVQKIYCYGLNPSKILTLDQAIAEGINVLEKTDDFDSFYMNVIDDPEKEIENIIQTLAANIIEQARKNYVFGYLCQEIDPWDFDLNLAMTHLLLADLKPNFPLHLQNISDTMFVKNLSNLILSKIHQNETVSKLLLR